MNRTANRTALCLCVAALLSACGGSTAFQLGRADNDASEIAAITARLQSASPAPERAIVAAIDDQDQLRLLALPSGQERWSAALDSPVSAPQIAGDVVVQHERRGVVVRSLQDGRELLVYPDGALGLVGAAGEGATYAFTLSTAGGVGAQSKLVIAEGGRVRHELSAETTIGTPALAAGLVFVPWATQNVSVLDAQTAQELARVRIAGESVGHAQRAGRQVYFSQRGIFRFDDAIAAGRSDAATSLRPEVSGLPGDPSLTLDTTRPTPSINAAQQSVRVVWAPSGDAGRDREGSVQLAGDALYAAYYRAIFAEDLSDPSAPSLRWAAQLPADVIGAAATEAGLALALKDGSLQLLAADDGAEIWSVQGAHPFKVASFEIQSSETAGQARAESLSDQLWAIASTQDARLVAAQTFATTLLGAQDDNDDGASSAMTEAATAHLITLCEAQRVAPPVREAGCVALAQRSHAGDSVREALAQRANFLDQVAAPPVGALAQLIANAGASELLPALIPHLFEPATLEEDLKEIVAAAAALEARDQLPALGRFFTRYHAGPRAIAVQDALVAIASAQLALDPEGTLALLQASLEDPSMDTSLRASLQALIDAHLQAVAAEEAAAAEAAAQAEAAEAAEREATQE